MRIKIDKVSEIDQKSSTPTTLVVIGFSFKRLG